MNKKALSVLLTIILLTTAITATQGFETNVRNYSAITADKFSDKSLIIGIKSNELYTRTISSDDQWNENIYSFERKIVSYCVFREKIYVLYPTNQRNVYKIGLIHKNTVKDYLILTNIRKLSVNSGLYVDKDETLYILNSWSQRVEIYNNKGKSLGTTKEKFNKILTLDGICYGVTDNTLQQLSSSGPVKTYSYDGNHTLYKVSENYLIDGNNRIWKISDNSLIKSISVKCQHPKLVCETKDFIVSASDNLLIAYDKQSGKVQHTYNPDIEIRLIISNRNSVTVFDKNYNTTTLSTKTIFPDKPTNNSLNSDKTTTATDSSTPASGVFDKGKILFVKQGTTIYQFKKQDKYSGLTVSFKDKNSGTIGTGMTVTISDSKKKKSYTTIVTGDITGEGNINSRDINAMFDHLLDVKKLKGAYNIAGDINKDNTISNADLVLLSKLIE